MKTNTIFAASIAATISTGMIHADEHEHKTSEDRSEAVAVSNEDIVTIAADSEDFTTLVAAIKAAGLAETLMGDGPFTVFAPTNEAFENLPEGMVVGLMEPENKEKLVRILSYHVIPKKLLSENAATMPLKTAEGSEATMTLDGDTVMIDGATIIEADVEASNGVIHAIDKVLLPSPDEDSEEEDQ